MPRHGGRDQAMPSKVRMVRLPDLGLAGLASCRRPISSQGRCSRANDAAGPKMQPGPMMQRARCSRGRCSRNPRRNRWRETAAMGDPCCRGTKAFHHGNSFGDFLYIRPRNANVAYGVVFNGPPDTPPAAATPIQFAPPGIASIDFHPAWRVGFAKALDECNAVVATFSHFEGEDQSSISTTIQYPIRSMVSHPSTWSSNASSDWLRPPPTMPNDLQPGRRRLPLDLREPERYSLEPVGRHAVRLARSAVGCRPSPRPTCRTCTARSTSKAAASALASRANATRPYGLVFYGRTAASLVAGTFRCAYTQIEPVITVPWSIPVIPPTAWCRCSTPNWAPDFRSGTTSCGSRQATRSAAGSTSSAPTSSSARCRPTISPACTTC